MTLSRRHILGAATGLAAASLHPGAAFAQSAAAPAPDAAADPRMADRTVGSKDAKTQVQEWFSFTCPHCARFMSDVFPIIQAQLIDTNKLLYIFKEYPRDQVDLMAAMVARSLPPERYLPFIQSLLANQMRWAFDRSVDPKEELAKQAALAGMPRATFDKVTNDQTLKSALLAAQAKAEKSYDIEATPTFVSGSKSHSGEMTYDEFSKWLGLTA